MSYNVKKIMQNAWTIAKAAAKETGERASKFFAESLKMAWAEEKSLPKTLKELTLPELVGTEKQIKWAEKIRKSALISLSAVERKLLSFIEHGQKINTEAAKKNLAVLQDCQKGIIKAASNNQAKFWIEQGKPDHDPIEQYMFVHQIGDVSLLASPKVFCTKLIAVLKQHNFI